MACSELVIAFAAAAGVAFQRRPSSSGVRRAVRVRRVSHFGLRERRRDHRAASFVQRLSTICQAMAKGAARDRIGLMQPRRATIQAFVSPSDGHHEVTSACRASLPQRRVALDARRRRALRLSLRWEPSFPQGDARGILSTRRRSRIRYDTRFHWLGCGVASIDADRPRCAGGRRVRLRMRS